MQFKQSLVCASVYMLFSGMCENCQADTGSDLSTAPSLPRFPSKQAFMQIFGVAATRTNHKAVCWETHDVRVNSKAQIL